MGSSCCFLCVCFLVFTCMSLSQAHFQLVMGMFSLTDLLLQAHPQLLLTSIISIRYFSGLRAYGSFGEQIFMNPLTCIGYCISFISLLQYITPNLVAYNNTFLLFNFWKSQVQNGYHWAKIKVEVEMCFFWRLWGALYFLAFSIF